MDAFHLSPGITPLLTDVALLIVLVPLGLGFALGGRRGFLVGFVLGSVVVSVIKLVTDWPDPWDDLVALAALGAALTWGAGELYPSSPRQPSWPLTVAVGLSASALGLVKVVTDFLDPFDLLVALAAVTAGVGLLRRARLRRTSDPR
jgi:hypothetical protein